VSDIELDLDAQIAAGLRAFFRIADAWGLTYAEASRLLGQPSKATFYKWKAGNVARIAYGYDLASRLSLVLGIYKALEIIYSDAE
ncbi:MAG: antitoxin Xre-like helix-turn-helix domain-containing protein, partial [Pseudomonadota bacterium]